MDASSFDSAVAAAKASGRPFRCEHDAVKGSSVVYLTDLEIAALQARAQAERTARNERDTARNEAIARLAAAGVAVADLKAALGK